MTDGTLTPDDASLTWAIGKAKPDFVGKRSLYRADMANPDRKQLVGLLTDDPKVVLQEGAQIVADPAGNRDWALHAWVDLDECDEAGDLVLHVTDFSRQD